MKWLKPTEVTEPGKYLFGIATFDKKYYHLVKVGRQQLSYNDGLYLDNPGVGDTHQKDWQPDFRFFGPIPDMEE